MNRLLSNELGQNVEILYAIRGCTCPDFPEGEGIYLYTSVFAATRSGVNLMEKATRKKKENKDSLSGAILICAVGVAAGVAESLFPACERAFCTAWIIPFEE